MDWISPGGVKYRAPYGANYGANNNNNTQVGIIAACFLFPLGLIICCCCKEKKCVVCRRTVI